MCIHVPIPALALLAEPLYTPTDLKHTERADKDTSVH